MLLIPINQLIINQPKWSIDKELIEDIKRRGQLEPIIVERRKNSRFYNVKDGVRRVLALRESGVSEVSAILIGE